MEDDYISTLREWERSTADPVIYENIDMLFPAYGFRRVNNGTEKDRWISPMKMDMTPPKRPNKEKTCVCLFDMRFHENGEWGDSVSIINKVMDDYNFGSVYEAYSFIADKFCLDMPRRSSLGPSSRIAARKRKCLESLQDYFVWNLNNNKSAQCRTALEYLHGRGFSDSEIAARKFGFVPDWDKVEAYITAPRMGFTKEEVDEWCKVRGENGKTTVGWLHVIAIPYRCGGDLKGFLFRACDPDVSPKYKANTNLDRKSVFFNMPEQADDNIIIVEGEMDALTASAAGVSNVVAVGGSDISGERRKQVYDALSRGVKEFILCLDLDTDHEGKPNHEKRYLATMKSVHTIKDISPKMENIRVVIFPYSCDPDEFIRKEGPDKFLKLVYNAPFWWDYVSGYMQGE